MLKRIFCSALLLVRPWSLKTSTAVKHFAWGRQKTISMCDCRAVTWTGVLRLVWSHSSSHWKRIHLWGQRPSQTTFTSPGLLRSCVRQILVSRFIQIYPDSQQLRTSNGVYLGEGFKWWCFQVNLWWWNSRASVWQREREKHLVCASPSQVCAWLAKRMADHF